MFHLCGNVSNLQDYRRDKIVKKMQEMITTLKWLDSGDDNLLLFFLLLCSAEVYLLFIYFVRVLLLFADLEKQETI